MGVSVSAKASGNTSRITLLDDQGDITYVGKAAPSSATSAPVWQVFRLQEVGSIFAVEFADGNDRFDNIWDDRASLSYS